MKLSRPYVIYSMPTFSPLIYVTLFLESVFA